MGGTKAKLISLFVTMALTVAVFVFGTVAFFTDETSSYSMGFKSGNLRMKLFETTIDDSGKEVNYDGSVMQVMPGMEPIDRIVRVENAGALDMYVRIAVHKTITLAERYKESASLVDNSLMEINIDTDHWVEQDGYYYYYKPLAPGEKTEPLFTEVAFSVRMGNIYKGSTALLDVVAYAVSAEDNGSAATEAQGWADAIVAGGTN